MRVTAIVACWAVIALCAACASDSDVRPASRPAADQADPSAKPDRLADVASRITLALADVCDCRGTQHAGSTTLRLCGYAIKIDNMSELEASTNGRRIRITSGMLRFFAHDDELAFVLAHEVSHILLGHAGAFDGLSARVAEAEADKLAIQIVSKSGFNTEIAANFPERLAQFYPSMNGGYGTYGMPAQRSAMISAALRGTPGGGSMPICEASATGEVVH